MTSSSFEMKKSEMRLPSINQAGVAIAALLLLCMAFQAYASYSQDKIAQKPKSAVLKVSGTNKEVAKLEVQTSRAGQIKGLSGRSKIEPNFGMLFPVRPAKLVQVWMKDVNFPLDILFVKDGTVFQVIENAPPCHTKKCPIYTSNGQVDTVIELHPSSEIQPGTKIEILYGVER